MSAITKEMLEEIVRKLEADSPAHGYAGLQFMPNANLTVRGPDQIVPRTIRERLFSLPWRPFQKTKAIPTMIPDPNVYATSTPEFIKIIGYPAIFGHPETIKRFQVLIDKELMPS